MSSTAASRFSWHGYQTAKFPTVAPWVETMGRVGHISKGVVYFVIGVLAFRLAIGAGGEVAGARDAIREIGQQSYGRILLGLTAIGLLAYTAWRLVQAVKDTEGVGTDAKGLTKRIAYGVSGLIYLTLGCFAGSLALGLGSNSSSSGSGSGAFLLDSPVGRVAVAIAGVITVIAGLIFIYKGYQAKFMTKYNLAEMGNSLRKTALHAGRTGLITRGIAVIIIGGFLVRSAWSQANSGEIAGMSDALAAIAAQPFGKILIGITGFGLMAYAVHMCLLGWYRHFNVRH